ncbi:cysteine desulfurase family protein (TIGR01976 family) [Allocatelliglobosispora scoriae]|uniref:Cysteine desulfurase family protein (TIGR01976 family) n=1 Tax=Allocatelliglobosispora scoriae TaxID=643052 RepID=A0A841C529_9ACTN|nr:cysteine desulfurase-like protein [Allocatelliglobosispora scoriae]MBB5873921.1 cysteine desulfurase family protein (TIGR01976 family) [Allocatelliglobosispora scoriae]
MAFEIETVRAAYPALAEGFRHFDAAAGSLVARPVADAAHTVLTGAVANRSTAFAPGRRAVEIVDAARAAVADLVGGEPGGVVFGNSATSLTYLVARTLARSWQPGDEVVVSRLDHDANIRPWVQVAADAGAVVRWAEFDPKTGELPVAQYADLITERTRVVAVTAASNAIGTRPDVAAIAALAHAVGAACYVDGVHSTPHQPVDVGSLGADFYVTSAYKWSGPHLAACVASPARWSGLQPQKLRPSSDDVPERFEFGTPSFASLAAVTAAVEHLAGLDGTATGDRRARLTASMTAAEAYEQGLFAELVQGLSAIDGVWLCPAPEDRCPTVAFRIEGQHPAETSAALGAEGICAFSGDYYAYEYFTAMGLRDSGGAVRTSIYHYNSAEDVAVLLAAVRRLAG